MRVFGKINNAIKNYVKEYVRFLMIPPYFCNIIESSFLIPKIPITP
jgi:hypothetical protein